MVSRVFALRLPGGRWSSLRARSIQFTYRARPTVKAFRRRSLCFLCQNQKYATQHTGIYKIAQDFNKKRLVCMQANK